MANKSSDDLFIGLIASLHASAWMLLGKVVHPMTGKVERHLEQAKETIDLLAMLEEKTRGNLEGEESRFLGQVLYELRMNYVEELKAPASAPEPAPADDTAEIPQANPEVPPSA
jgi:hypothetical protein